MWELNKVKGAANYVRSAFFVAERLFVVKPQPIVD